MIADLVAEDFTLLGEAGLGEELDHLVDRPRRRVGHGLVFVAPEAGQLVEEIQADASVSTAITIATG